LSNTRHLAHHGSVLREGEYPPGTILARKYQVVRTLGQGGMGRVVEARHIALGERVALKFLLSEHAQSHEATTRFLREAQAAVRLRSEHVARVSDVGTLEDGAPYMVMEYLEGQDLSKLLKTHGKLHASEAVDFVVQAAEAIAEAHAIGIVHRDIKPGNLFLTRGLDGSPLVKVLDFGISKFVESVDDLTRTATAMGSALYMSPEQMRGARDVDHRTDIYALGVTLFELLVGRQPFYADTLPQLCAEVLEGNALPLRSARPDLPDAFASVLERAYAKRRDDRYPSVAHFVLAMLPYALPRTRVVIERIARMAGLDPAAAPAWAPSAAASTGTQLPAPLAALAPQPNDPAPPAPPAPPAGASTSRFGVAAPAPAPAQPPRRSGALAGLALVGMAAVGAAAYFLGATRSAGPVGASALPSSAVVTPASPPSAPPSGPSTSAGAAPASASASQPVGSASASASVLASPSASSAFAPASAKPRLPNKPKPSPETDPFLQR
jgi:serine/threonine protein kinase